MRLLRTLIIILSGILVIYACNRRPPISSIGSVGAVSGKYYHIPVLEKKRPISKLSSDTYEIIAYSAHIISYNSKRKIPNWVSYELLASETDGPNSRKGLKFCPDPSLNLPQADDCDYRNSGWSRGHMAPAADFKWSQEAIIETFYFTNCCPQNQKLNSGQWSTLEKKVRMWANQFGQVVVVTGPLVWENQYGTIGEHNVVVPDAFFKAVLAGKQSIAFVMYNKANNENMQRCAMSVDKLEELSGFDFFTELDDTIESVVEATYDLKKWGL
ncbi:MAG: DNA/RNA non-specific endonuclease [Bacteroidales bacterium]|nr:DNA/RNA non-specific endonuclease [Bacteroidales bacterium]